MIYETEQWSQSTRAVSAKACGIRGAPPGRVMGVNFTLFSAHATRVELCLFDETGEREPARIDLPEYTDEIWHAYLAVSSPERSTAIVCTAPASLARHYRQGHRQCLLLPAVAR